MDDVLETVHATVPQLPFMIEILHDPIYTVPPKFLVLVCEVLQDFYHQQYQR